MKNFIKLFEFLFKYYNIYKLDYENIRLIHLKLPEGLIFKELNESDFYLFQKLDLKSDYLKICYKRLISSDIISYAIVDLKKDCLAAYSFINLSETYYLSALNKKINQSKLNCVFFEDDNTLLNYRRIGLSSYIMNERIRYAKLNKKNALGFAHPSNLPSIKTLVKFNFKKTHNFPIAIRKEAFVYLFKKYLCK
jgi:hypothetical protein